MYNLIADRFAKDDNRHLCSTYLPLRHTCANFRRTFLFYYSQNRSYIFPQRADIYALPRYILRTFHSQCILSPYCKIQLLLDILGQGY
jgi:hypothetical protein